MAFESFKIAIIGYPSCVYPLPHQRRSSPRTIAVKFSVGVKGWPRYQMAVSESEQNCDHTKRILKLCKSSKPTSAAWRVPHWGKSFEFDMRVTGDIANVIILVKFCVNRFSGFGVLIFFIFHRLKLVAFTTAVWTMVMFVLSQARLTIRLVGCSIKRSSTAILLLRDYT